MKECVTGADGVACWPIIAHCRRVLQNHCAEMRAWRQALLQSGTLWPLLPFSAGTMTADSKTPDTLSPERDFMNWTEAHNHALKLT